MNQDGKVTINSDGKYEPRGKYQYKTIGEIRITPGYPLTIHVKPIPRTEQMRMEIRQGIPVDINE